MYRNPKNTPKSNVQSENNKISMNVYNAYYLFCLSCYSNLLHFIARAKYAFKLKQTLHLVFLLLQYQEII